MIQYDAKIRLPGDTLRTQRTVWPRAVTQPIAEALLQVLARRTAQAELLQATAALSLVSQTRRHWDFGEARWRTGATNPPQLLATLTLPEMPTWNRTQWVLQPQLLGGEVHLGAKLISRRWPRPLVRRQASTPPPPEAPLTPPMRRRRRFTL